MRKTLIRTSYIAILLVAALTVSALTGCAAPPPPPSPSPSASPSPKPPPTTPPAPATPSPTVTRYTLNLAVSPPGSGTVTPSSGAYASGVQVALQAKPAGDCWTFDRWTGDASGNTASMPLVMTGNKSVTANFVKIKYSLSVSVSPPRSGSVGPLGGNYECGQSVTIVATPATGYEFERWGGDATGNRASANVTMQANRNVTAFFKETYQTIKREMPAGSGILNTVSFSSHLKAVDRIQGVVGLTGERHPEDATFGWSFTITAPLGVIIEDWRGNVLSSQSYAFDKTAPADGQYVMKIAHTSHWAKSLTIQIKPGGWQ